MFLEHQGPALKPCSHVTKFSTTFWLKFPSIFLPTLFGWRIEFQAKFAPKFYFLIQNIFSGNSGKMKYRVKICLVRTKLYDLNVNVTLANMYCDAHPSVENIHS